MSMCMAATGGQFAVVNTVETKTVDFLGAKKIEDYYLKARVTDKGIRTNAMIGSALMLALAVGVQVMAMKAARDEYQIGKRQLKLGQSIWDRFGMTYLPMERQVAMAMLFWVPVVVEYVTLSLEYAQISKDVLSELEIPYGRYSLCVDRDAVLRMSQRRNILGVDLTNLAARIAEERYETERDKKWNERANFLNLGRDLMAQSAKYMASGVSALRDYRSTLQGFAGDIAGFAGYKSVPSKAEQFSQQAGGLFGLGASSPTSATTFSEPRSAYGLPGTAVDGISPYERGGALENAAGESGAGGGGS